MQKNNRLKLRYLTFLFFTYALSSGYFQANAQSCQPAPVGLVSWYAGDNNVLDARSRNNGTLQNGATFGTGQVGQALSFDGVDDFVDIPNAASLNNLTTQATFEAWIHPQANGQQYIFAHRTPGLFESFSLRTFDTGELSLVVAVNGGTVVEFQTSPGTIQLNQWQHIAVTVNTTTDTAKAVVNGTQTAFPRISGGSLGGASLNAVSGNFIGQRQSGLNFFKGLIDEASAYSIDLTTAQIQSVFNAGLSGKCRPTAAVPPSGNVAWLTGDGDAGDTAGTNSGALQAGARFRVGRVGQAFSIGGNLSGDNVRLASGGLFRNQSNAAVEAWIFPRGAGSIGGQTLFFEDVGINPGSRVQITRSNSGAMQFFGRDAAGTVFNVTTPAGAAPLNSWTHFAGVYEAGVGVKIYIDGVLAATLNNAALTSFSADNSAAVRIGAAGAAGVFGEFNGDVDEFSVYNRALTDAEIQSIVKAGIAGKLKQKATFSPSSLISLYQGENNANDARGFNNASFGANTYAAGRIGQAFNFTAQNQFVDIPNNAAYFPTNAITAEAWVNPSTFSGCNDSYRIVHTVQSQLRGWLLGLNCSGTVFAQIFNDAGQSNGITSTVSLPTGQFTHVALTWDGANLRLYIDGILNSTVVTTIAALGSNTDNLRIGNAINFGFVGRIDEVGIYNRALAATEIRANYESGNALSTLLGDARITFPSVTAAGTTQQIPLDLSLLPPLPVSAATTNLTYDIATTADFTGSPTICFNLPAFTDSTVFSSLRILHLENNVWQNRTDPASVNFAAKTVCTSNLPSLSPFAVVSVAPTAANATIGGQLRTAGGSGLRNAVVTLSNTTTGETRSMQTGAFGRYYFDDLAVGQTYLVSVEAKRYQFAAPTRIINLAENVTDADFISEDR